MGTKGRKGAGRMRALAGGGAVLAASLAFGMLALSLRGQVPALAQDAMGIAQGEVGVPWVGELGITETVDEIMSREALLPRHVYRPEELREPKPGRLVPRGDDEDDPDRTNLPQNPDSSGTAQWPPPANNGPIELPPPDGVPPRPLGSIDATGDVVLLQPQAVGTSFIGAQASESGFIPPDSMGAVGPTQVLAIVNGRIKVFSKAGVLGPLNATTDSFFSSVRNGSGTSDPRVRFDRTSNRWFISMVNVSTPNRVLLAVSSGPTITGAASFTFFQFQHDLVGTTPNVDTGGFADYDTLGVDVNAVYIGDNVFNPGYIGTTGFVIQKSSVTSGGPIVVTAFRHLAAGTFGAGPFAPGGADNDDPNATEGYFVGSDNASFGIISIRRVTTPGGTPTISGNIAVTVPSTSNPIAVPALGSTTPLETSDDRHFNAVIHLDRVAGTRTLWLAHHIQVDATGVASATGGRDGARWYQIQDLTTTPTLRQSGTVFSSAASNPASYFYPSIAMSGQGHMALASTVAGAAEHAEIAVAGRLASDPLGTTQAPTVAQTSSTSYTVLGNGRNRWGDFSHTCVDPADDQTMWTFQEYCNGTNSWAVRAIKLVAPLPALPASCSPPTVAQGTSNINVIVTGTSSGGSGFYDTDASYTNRMAVTVDGGNVTVNSATFNSPTQITMNISVDPGAALSARNVTVVNPDGQLSGSASGILTITSSGTSPLITLQPQDQTACAGGSASFTVAASGAPAPTYQWRRGTTNLIDGGNISGATTATLTVNPVGAGDAATDYNCVATNANGSAASNNASLTVNSAVLISGQPGDQTACSGGPASFSVTATGTPPPTYQWRRGVTNLVDGGQISGATTATLTINPAGAGDAAPDYNCVVNNACGTATSNNAALAIDVGPAITVPPVSQALVIGGTAVFSVSANSVATLTYQWRKNTVPLTDGGSITGSSTATLTINPVAATDAGRYDVVVTDVCGTATSGAAAFWRRGDMNCDGIINFADINPFVQALNGQAAYEARYPDCNYLNADINNDNVVNFADINPFVVLLS